MQRVQRKRDRNDASDKRRRAALVAIFAATSIALLCGCNSVRRRLTITTEPSGAIVYLNNKELGRSPISHNFIHSGVYEIRCYKEGYETERKFYKAGTPWYLYPGIDFFSENFVAGELRDEQRCHIELKERREVPSDEMYEKAAQLRDEAHKSNADSYFGTTDVR